MKNAYRRIADREFDYANYASALCFFAASVFAGVMYLQADDSTNREALSAVLGLLVALLFERLVGIWGSRHEQSKRRAELESVADQNEARFQQVSEQIRSLRDSWLDRFPLEYVGPTNLATKTVSDKITELVKSAPGQIDVRNTFVLLKNFRHRSQAEFMQIILAYEAVLSNNGSVWTDLISINELFSPRYETIFSDASRFPKGGLIGTHKVAVLRHNVPLINFIIIDDKKSKRKYIYFGWVYGPEDEGSDVFYSEDAKLIELFDHHFEVLVSHKVVKHGVVEVDYTRRDGNRLRQSDIVDRQGVWFTVAFNLDNDKVAIESIGFVRIAFDEVKLLVDGFTINAAGKHKPIGADDIQHTTRRIHFDYKTRDHRSPRNGFCTYRFEKVAVSDFMQGFFTNDRDHKKVDLVGVRIANASPDRNPMRGLPAVTDIRAAAALVVHLAGLREIHLPPAHIGALLEHAKPD